MMDKPSKQNSGVRKRSSNACVRCRQQKIKCTGIFPCQPCTRRHLICSFDDSTQKITVTKGYIQDLQKKADYLQTSPGGHNVHFGAIPSSAEVDRTVLQDDVNTWLGSVEEPPPPQHGAEQNTSEGDGTRRAASSPGAQLMNPLAIDAGNFIADSAGRPFHLGAASNWSFGRRVLRMACDKLKVQLPTEELHFEGCVYNLEWHVLKQSPQPHTQSLPSPDYAVYLINATKFHCGQLFHLFDEEDFMKHFAVFHEDRNGMNKVPQLWYIHYLLIIAFGKAFVARSANSRRPPGADLFLEAMRRLPEIVFFAIDPIETVEILICAALYLQCLDFRSTAYNLIGQALRKALEQGMFTKMSSQHLTSNVVDRCHRIWWTVYMLDRQMCSLMGLPQAIRDEDISAPIPVFANSPQKTIALELNIKLSRVLADILNTVYSTEGRLARKFLASTKQALKSIANITDELKKHIELPDNQSLAGISRTAAYLHLLHHQCIVLTTRPLAYSFLERRLRNADANVVYARPTGSVRVLLKTCIESAQQMLYILASLQNQGLLESFLPFDLESAFISTIILIMTATIDTSLLEEHSSWSETAYSILDEMGSRGNMIAVFRKNELQKLAGVLGALPPPRTANQPHTELGQNDIDTLQTSSNADFGQDVHPSASRRMSGTHFDDQGLETTLWQDELTAEQLMLIADSLDLDGLDWMTTSLGDSSVRSQTL